jgi:Domain of unknown function (DUF4129)
MRARSAVTVTALVVAGAGLVAAAVGGTRAVGQLELEFRPLFALPGLSLEVVLLVAALLCLPALVAGRLLRRRRRDPNADPRWEWLRRLVSLMAVIAAVLVLRELLDSQDSAPSHGDGSADAAAGDSDVTGWSGWIGILALGLTVVASGMLWWRARAARRGTSTPAALDRDDGLDAIAAGRAALDEPVGDPRAAVVACYAAMEATLNSAGSGRRPAESPEEFLARTVAEGRLPAEPGRRLTRLFLAARYSSAPVTAADVAAGREALSRIDAGVRS